MVSDFSPAVSTVICIDLLNASAEDIHNYCLMANAANGLQMYLKHLHTSLHNDPWNKFNPHLVYIEGDYVLGTIRQQEDLNNFKLGGIEILPDTGIDKLDKSIFKLLENQLFKNNNLELTPFMLSTFNRAFQNLLKTKKYDTVFFHAHIEVSGTLAIPILVLSRKYNCDIVFLDCVNKIDESHLILHKIYYKNRLPIVFVFKGMDGLAYLGWDKEYLNTLRNITPIGLQMIEKKDTVNAILDKINNKGISNLDKEDIAFLNQFSNS